MSLCAIGFEAGMVSLGAAVFTTVPATVAFTFGVLYSGVSLLIDGGQDAQSEMATTSQKLQVLAKIVFTGVIATAAMALFGMPITLGTAALLILVGVITKVAITCLCVGGICAGGMALASTRR